jgi:putative transcriptional regulator
VAWLGGSTTAFGHCAFTRERYPGRAGLRIGVTRQTIAAIEQGKYSPTLETAFRIADVFDVPLEKVFSWDSA